MSGKPIWPPIPAGFVRAMLAGHSALGLAFAALIYVVCFTGAVAVFTQEFHRWEEPQIPRSESVSPQAVETAFHEMMDAYPWAHDVFINLPGENTGFLNLEVYPDHDADIEPVHRAADAQGHLGQEVSEAFSHFQSRLHILLHLPRNIGGFIVGLTGVALLSSLVSGILSHPRVFRDAFSLRIGGNKRLQEADIHNRISVWGLPFHIIVSLTGAFLGLVTLIAGILALVAFKGDVNAAYALFMGPRPEDNPAPAAQPMVRAALEDIAVRAPDGRPVYIMVGHPGEEGASVTIGVHTDGHLARGEMHVYDRKANYLGPWGYESGPAGQRILAAMEPLHFGWFGGWPVKVIYGLLGLGLASVTSSGVAIWLARRRAKGRPAKVSERLWPAVVWSQPLIYTIVAGVALVTRAEAILPPLWLALSLLCLLGAAFSRAERVSFVLRVATVAGLIGLTALHVVLKMLPDVAQADPVAWIVDLGLLLCAGALWAGLWYNRKPEAHAV